jgi:hypothetical protein
MRNNPGGIGMTYLRNYLEPTKAFSKTQNPATAYDGFIKGVVSIGSRAGIVKVEGLPSLGKARIMPSSTQRVSSDGEPAAVTATPSSNQPAIVSPKTEPSSPARRVDTFLAVFKKRELGPFSRDRQFLLDRLNELAAEGEYTCSRLFQALKEKCKRSTKKKIKLPWGIVDKFLYTTLSRVPILLGENDESLRPDNVNSLGKKVKRLETDFADRIDRELLFALIDELNDVGPRDLKDLAFVLYPDKDTGEALQLVEQHLRTLQTDARIEQEGNSFRSLKSA